MNTNRLLKAFTLVELLVVITIIGILASLITVAANSAYRSVNTSRVKMEIHQIEMAIEQYKNLHGEYPPDFSDNVAVVRHVKKRWPRFALPSGSIDVQAEAIKNAINNVYRNSNVQAVVMSNQSGLTLTSGASGTDFMGKTKDFSNFPGFTGAPSGFIGSLAFWLGGFPSGKGDGSFGGFSADPEAPFGIDYATPNASKINNGDAGFAWDPDKIDLGQRESKLIYDLEMGKNVMFVVTASTANPPGIVFPVLVRKKSSDEYAPYVYMRGKADAGQAAYVWGTAVKSYNFATAFASTPWADLGFISAYAKSGNPFASSGATPVVWFNSDTYQIIHPGLDGKFGSFGTLSSPGTSPFNPNYFRSINQDAVNNTLGQGDMDNIVNFGEGTTIKALLP